MTTNNSTNKHDTNYDSSDDADFDKFTKIRTLRATSMIKGTEANDNKTADDESISTWQYEY